MLLLIAELALKYRLPSMSASPRFAESFGGLMAYGPDSFEQFRCVADHVAKVLEGARAGEIPVEQPRSLQLVINKKTAAALGLTIPPELLLQADKVIE